MVVAEIEGYPCPKIFEVSEKVEKDAQHKNQPHLRKGCFNSALIFCFSPRRIIVFSLVLTFPHPYHHSQEPRCVSVQKYRGREEDAFGFGGFTPLAYMYLEIKSCEVGED